MPIVFVDAFIESILETLGTGEEVSLLGFGKYTVTERPERMGRNPKTGEEVKVSASKSPKFKAGKLLKDAVNGK